MPVLKPKKRPEPQFTRRDDEDGLHFGSAKESFEEEQALTVS
jgi:hypothetical protein